MRTLFSAFCGGKNLRRDTADLVFLLSSLGYRKTIFALTDSISFFLKDFLKKNTFNFELEYS